MSGAAALKEEHHDWACVPPSLLSLGRLFGAQSKQTSSAGNKVIRRTLLGGFAATDDDDQRCAPTGQTAEGNQLASAELSERRQELTGAVRED